jgi:hypothetical protein
LPGGAWKTAAGLGQRYKEDHMRKLLLASAAMLGATAGGAFAQARAAAPSQGQYVAPWAAGPSANNNNNSIGIAGPGSTAVPTPGTVVIRLNGRVQTEMGAGWSSIDKATTAGTRFEVNPIRFTSYMRLYPGFDGLTTNGLRYGGSVEFRENFGPAAGSPSAYSSTETVFVRRAFAYMGTDQAGIVRIGQTDGVIGLFDGGVFTSQTWDGGVGNFNGGQSQAWGVTNATGVTYAWLSQAGSEYSNTKIVYLSPQFFGFDFGVQYAPSMFNGYTSCAAPAQTCPETITGNDTTRWYNQVAVGARYQGKFAGLGVKAMVVYETAAKESSGVAGGAATPTIGGNAANFKYDNLSFVNAAAAIDFAGVTVAADYIGGALNGQLAMRPQGGASEHAVVAGVTYRNGPIIVGAEAAMVNSQGDARLTGISQRRELEASFGGTYTVAPGLALVAEYQYEQRHQGNFDFLTGAAGTGTRDTHAQAISFATIVTW